MSKIDKLFTQFKQFIELSDNSGLVTSLLKLPKNKIRSIIDIYKGEKTMANTTVSKITITKENADALVTHIQDGLRTINKGYLAIAPEVQKLYDTKAFEVLGYENFDKMCGDLFEMSHGTTVGIRKVFARFGSKSSKDGSYTIPEKYLEWGYTKLLFFANDAKKFEQANINPLEVFEPKMTIGEMKLALATALVDKANEQDATAIDTDGSIIDSEEQPNEEQPNEEQPNEEQPTFNDWAQDPKGYCDYILRDMEALKTLLEDNIKPEKLTVLEGAIAYMKEVKKAIKK